MVNLIMNLRVNLNAIPLKATNAFNSVWLKCC